MQISRWNQVGSGLELELRNPNADVGLVRSGFTLTAFTRHHKVLQVFGQDGVPGALCCTIYMLPPRSKYAMSFLLNSKAHVATIRLDPSGDWIDWSSLHVQGARAKGVTVRMDNIGDPHMTGLVSLSGPKPLNAVVIGEANYEGDLVVFSDLFDCVRPGEPKPFDINEFDVSFPFGGSTAPRLRHVYAYPTTAGNAGEIPPPTKAC